MSLPTTVGWYQMPPHQPAYNPVYARQTLARPVMAPEQTAAAAPPPPPPPPPPPAEKPKIKYGLAVREYVQRTFGEENAVEGIERSEIEAKLKDIISHYATQGDVNDNDWANFPLPQTIIQQERVNVVALPANLTPWASYPPPAHTAPPYAPDHNYSSSLQSRKRKSTDEDLATHAQEAIPPWRRGKGTIEDRISYPNQTNEKRQRKYGLTTTVNSKFNEADLERRRQRFQTGRVGNKTTPPWGSPRADNSESEAPAGPVVGTNQDLEKRYLRLTAPPKPETVRPQAVLEKTLALLKKKWKSHNNYNYICDQFKSLRQDLTVQHIKNSFTVDVYEIHARIALEKGDLGEYNQCQTQLRGLYSQKLGGKPSEFLAYRILYYIYMRNQTDMNDLLAELTPSDKNQSAVKHALDVRSALALGNYHKLFRLYLVAPNMGAYLMDMFIERERLNALANISRAYMLVQLRFLTDELGFDSDEECKEFLEKHGARNLIVEATVKPPQVNLKNTAAMFEKLRAEAFNTVDIKGQI